jgi:adenosylcobinamide-phosphate guanylyltransferase
MIGLVMAGGKGTRMDHSNEKLLLQYKKPVVLNVVDSLRNSNCFSKVIVATSPNSPNTKSVLEQNDVETLATPGNGYTNDLNSLLKEMQGFLFVISGDLPLLDEKIIQVMTGKFNPKNIWTSFLVSKNFLNSLNLESDLIINDGDIECVYTGISIINADKITNLDSIKETYIILDDKRIAFNLNTKKDYELLNSS